jgi:hypothetical protein
VVPDDARINALKQRDQFVRPQEDEHQQQHGESEYNKRDQDFGRGHRGMQLLNPMLQNDPVLEFLVRKLHLEPITVALLSFLLIPGALILWCWRSGTLRIPSSMANSEGHGLFSAINLYILLVPPLNYVIFRYYDVYTTGITALCDRGVLPVTPSEIFSALAGWQAKLATAVSLLISLICSVIAICWVRWIRRVKNTNWLCSQGKPRLISWYFYGLFFLVELGIIFNWILRHILIWRRLNTVLQRARTDPYSMDRMFGLGPLSDLSMWAFWVVSLATLLVALWLLGTRITLRKGRLYKNPGHLMATIAVLVLAPAAVILPLGNAHQLMRGTQERALNCISKSVSARYKAIEGQIEAGPSGTQVLKELNEQVDSGNRLYALINSNSTWPLTGFTLGSFSLGFLSPLLLPLTVEVGKRLLARLWHN